MRNFSNNRGGGYGNLAFEKRPILRLQHKVERDEFWVFFFFWGGGEGTDPLHASMIRPQPDMA